ncbi:uncharacterized protein VDAG_00457 [Verticillium dahliae VdLs.17]|uniref:Uncharacterized protein n=1 Tax=Verticillium dahliae (strain VdLs.17 / ATCC MYA-4575 / FGSC 10137) TaxID=498257 RepID=G2WSC4_VERDV|nr:uncharacterized protein VDAG_00457 [Verticillium dahliae VdLs.17]EGY13775.1 hypothetical protein VDAG_00457 [Verticillium dahliae VdLs.17]
MGRKPNPIICEYFTRGPKLTDSSNRYPHKCKLCGENFPKGRGEALTKHITEKCPAITPEQRINAALNLSGLQARSLASRHLNDHVRASNGIASANEAPEAWDALQTLAEASRQVGATEMVPQNRNLIDPAIQQFNPHHGQPDHTSGLELQEQFTLENPPPSYEQPAHREKPNHMHIDDALTSYELPDQRDKRADEQNASTLLTAEQKLEHLQVATQQQSHAVSPEDSASLNAAVAAVAAATARLNHQLLDESRDGPSNQEIADALASPMREVSAESHHSGPPHPQQPWGEMSYVHSSPIPPASLNLQPAAHMVQVQPAPLSMSPVHVRGGTRMSIGNGVRSEHKRKAYNPSLTLYSAGLVVVLSQNRVNQARSAFELIQNGTKVRVAIWNDSVPMSLFALVTARPASPTEDLKTEEEAAEPAKKDEAKVKHQAIMIDQDKEDLPARMETYVREMLPLLIERETSHFVRVVLEFAQKAEQKTGDLVTRALELWGLIEILDHERSWTISEEQDGKFVAKTPDDDGGSTQDLYTLMTWQLSAAAERKANAVSQKLVNELQRCLENGKVTLHFDVYLTILLLLHCLEKTTWTMKVWEMDDFRQRWPLDRPPSAFTTQGQEIAELLKMLLALRKAHPKTFRGHGGLLEVFEPQSQAVADFFGKLSLQYDEVVDRLKGNSFTPRSSSSLEFQFSGIVLLPRQESDAVVEQTAVPAPDAAQRPDQAMSG